MSQSSPRTVSAYVDTIPVGRTSRRLDWLLLPPMLRRLIEERIGSPVVHAKSAGAGFTPGFASVLTCEDGSRHFVKAASTKAQRTFADSYREEMHKLRALPPGVPVPRLLWSHEDDLWVVLGLEYVAGANPARPWDPADLDACLDTLETLAAALTPAPPPLDPLASFADEFADCLVAWDQVARQRPDLPHLEEARRLASSYVAVTAGSTLVHTDARDDNFLLTGERALLCDWNWPVRGAAWIDTVLLLVSAHGDGLDADGLLAARALTREVDPQHVDTLLALLAGYFFERGGRPTPNSSPHLRAHQRWYAEATWSWLSRRRGWT